MQSIPSLQYKKDIPVDVKNALSFDFGLPFNAFLSKSHFTLTNLQADEIFGFIFNSREIKEKIGGEDWPTPVAFLHVKMAFFDLILSQSSTGLPVGECGLRYFGMLVV